MTLQTVSDRDTRQLHRGSVASSVGLHDTVLDLPSREANVIATY